MKKLLIFLPLLFFNQIYSQDCESLSCISNPVIIQLELIDCFTMNDSIFDQNGGFVSECSNNNCLDVCENSVNTYTTPYHVGSSYLWTVNGGQIININNFQNQILVKWGSGPTGSVRVEELDSNSCDMDDIICINIKPTPMSSISISPNLVSYCKDAEILFKANDTNSHSLYQTLSWCDSTTWDSTQFYYSLNYFWDFGDGNTSILRDPSHSYSSTGLKTITLIISNSCQCSDTVSIDINITNDIASKITSCFGAKCEGDTVQYCTDAVLPFWEVIGGSIYYSQNSDSCINVIWNNNDTSLNNGSGTLLLTDLSSTCLNATSLSIPIIPQSPEINGVSIACPQTFETYSFQCIPGADYFWQISGSNGIIMDGQYTSEITVHWTNSSITSQQVQLNISSSTLDCNISQVLLNVDILPRIYITGNNIVCEEDKVIYQDNLSNIFEWTTYNGTVINPISPPFLGTQFEVDWNIGSGIGVISATPISSGLYCETSTNINITIHKKPKSALSIIGDTIICPNLSEMYSTSESNITESLNSTYIWNITGGNPNNIKGNNVNINWSNSPPFSLEVYNLSSDGCYSDTINQSVILSSISPIISGPDTTCIDNITNFSVSSFSSNSYFYWSILNSNMGSVISGQGGTNPQIEWGNINGTTSVLLSVESCGNTYNTSFTVTVVGSSISISTSPNLMCSESFIQITSSVSSGNFIWDFGDGDIDSTLGFSVVHMYDEPGKYPLTVTNYNPQSQCETSRTFDIQIIGIKGNISPEISSIDFCNGTNISQQLSIVTESNSSPSNISWYLDNVLVQSSSIQYYTVIDIYPNYYNLGVYSAIITDSNGCNNILENITLDTITCNGGGQGTILPISFLKNCNSGSGDWTVTYTSPNANPVNWSNGVVNSLTSTEIYDKAGEYTLKFTTDELEFVSDEKDPDAKRGLVLVKVVLSK